MHVALHHAYDAYDDDDERMAYMTVTETKSEERE